MAFGNPATGFPSPSLEDNMKMRMLKRIVREEMQALRAVLQDEDDGRSLMTIVSPPREHFEPFDLKTGPRRDLIHFGR